MRYTTTTSPGHESVEYQLPAYQPTASQQASDNAKAQVAHALDNTGWVQDSTGDMALHDKLQQWSSIPASYTSSPEGLTKHTVSTTVKRDEQVYHAVALRAWQTALQLLPDNPNPKERLLIHTYAIQEAITAEIRPYQESAERHMQALNEATVATWETAISTEEVYTHQAEVCIMKATIAKAYLETALPDDQISLIAETGTWADDAWHMYVQIQHEWTTYTFHPNSPHQYQWEQWKIHYLPQIEGINPEKYTAFLTKQRATKTVSMEKNSLAA